MHRTISRLQDQSRPGIGRSLAAAAIRELFEETGLVLGCRGSWSNAPIDWQDFAATGQLTTCFTPSNLSFGALTPPGRPRRFDARFFLVDANDLASDLDDFKHASDELSHLQWIYLDKVRSFDMPFITECGFKAKLAQELWIKKAPSSVPYFKNDDEESVFTRLYGKPINT